MHTVVIGAGLAGLSCTRHLLKAGCRVDLYEASDDVGGRARTDTVEGFQLDRGFQVLLTAYPETNSQLDYEELKLSNFTPGALIRYKGQFRRFIDPLREPRAFIATALSPIATIGDKLRINRLRNRVLKKDLSDIYVGPEQSTRQYLEGLGFSPRIMQSFFQPFLGGVFLDPELETTKRMFEFVYSMFAQGYASLPANGMGAIATQLASQIPTESLLLNTPVESVRPKSIQLADGKRIEADAVVVATDGHAATVLMNNSTPAPHRSVACLYFIAPHAPVKAPLLILNGEGRGPVNNLCFADQVASTYSPDNRSLVSVTVLESQDSDEPSVRAHLREWFGKQVDQWEMLRRYDIDYALPTQIPDPMQPMIKPVEHVSGVFICGDHRDTASINGAMASGRRAAAAVLNSFGAPHSASGEF